MGKYCSQLVPKTKILSIPQPNYIKTRGDDTTIDVLLEEPIFDYDGVKLSDRKYNLLINGYISNICNSYSIYIP